MAAMVRLATTDAERDAIYRLRYEVYVDEMHSIYSMMLPIIPVGCYAT